MSETNNSSDSIEQMEHIETQMHNAMQIMRYKMHTLMKHWESTMPISTEIEQNKQHQWMQILDNHIYRLNKMLDTALSANGLEFNNDDFQRLENEYNKKLFGVVTSTNPMWLSMLLLLSNYSNNASDSNDFTDLITDPNTPFQSHLDMDNEQNQNMDTTMLTDDCIIDINDIENDYGESSTNMQNSHLDTQNDGPDWNWWGDWEMVGPMTDHTIDAIKKGKIKVD